MPVKQLGQAQMPGQGGRQDQPSIGHQTVVVKGDGDAVGVVAWQHLLGAPGLGSVWRFKNHYPRSTGALSYPFNPPSTHLFGGLGLIYPEGVYKPAAPIRTPPFVVSVVLASAGTNILSWSFYTYRLLRYREI